MLFMDFILIQKKKVTAVLTSDGGGDGAYNTVNIFKKGKFFLINKSKKKLDR